jgi:hypothetical protein
LYCVYFADLRTLSPGLIFVGCCLTHLLNIFTCLTIINNYLYQE